jgi:hypothetical protein
MRSEILLLPASLIWPRLRGPAAEDEARLVRPPVSASIAAITLSRCSVSASMMLGVSMALNYKTFRIQHGSRTCENVRQQTMREYGFTLALAKRQMRRPGSENNALAKKKEINVGEPKHRTSK